MLYGREIKPVGDIIDLPPDGEWANIAETQLAERYLETNVLCGQPNLISRLVLRSG